ncbi:CLUMA_CG007836, isoform A [Clunio marinus]|uniref:RNA polymerase II subunit B1 CTD phosphatase RPAP2 homolog n=1 Tax=Clunio marinus TaxID=568069 RepID=A0A1J1I7C6_9DIPT|nr:CLUMA_CG007836, isoform A [Clunio marinus]
MDKDKYFYMPRVFQAQDVFQDHVPCDQLENDTTHPNLNTRHFEYKIRTERRPQHPFLPVYSFIRCFDKFLVVGSNEFAGIEWEGNITGATDIDVFTNRDKENVSFCFMGTSTVTGFKVVDNKTFIVATQNSLLELYQMQSDINDQNSQQPYKTYTQNTFGYVKCIDTLKDETKLITGTEKGTLNLHDYEFSELYPCSTFNYAHGGAITGVSSHPSASKIWASCSTDKSCLLWDLRKEKPALGLLRDYKTWFTALYWTKRAENREYVMLGDDVGNVLTIDPRRPNHILNKKKVSDRDRLLEFVVKDPTTKTLIMDETNPSVTSRPKSPRSKRAAAVKRLQKMNQEQLLEALRKKKECNAKAQTIVERLLDPFDDGKELLLMLRDINQCHYQDIVEERAIMKLCGYPLCKEVFKEIPKQQFHISTATNKVYDLSDRKHFCSGKCLRLSNYLKTQLLTSPLWMRDKEIIPEFKLLSLE